MNHQNNVPNVLTRSQSPSDTGNAENTPIQGDNVPNVPNVLTEVEIRIQQPVCVHTNGNNTHAPHTNCCKGGSLVSKSGNVGTLDDLQVVERVPSSGNAWERSGNKSGNAAAANDAGAPNVTFAYVEDLLLSAIRQGISFRLNRDTLTTEYKGDVVDAIMNAYAEKPILVRAAMVDLDRRQRRVIDAIAQPGVYSISEKAEIEQTAETLGIELAWQRIAIDWTQATQKGGRK